MSTQMIPHTELNRRFLAALATKDTDVLEEGGGITAPVGDYIQSGFESFHAKNPSVYRKLVDLAYAVKAAGFKKYSMKSLFERVRWHHQIERKETGFLLNNNYTSRYARLIMANEPGLRDFFETRVLN